MSTATTAGPLSGSSIYRYFKISERGSSIGQEVRGGVVTFFTMAYIVVLNPLILGFVQDADGKYLGGGDAPNLAAIAAGTALVAGVLTILMGVFANYPLALASALAKIAGGVAHIPNPAAERHPATASLFIINPLSGHGMDNLFSTHPATENRIMALQALAREMGPSEFSPAGVQSQPRPGQSSRPWGSSPRRGPWG